MSDTLIRSPEGASKSMVIDADVHPWINGDVAGLTLYPVTVHDNSVFLDLS